MVFLIFYSKLLVALAPYVILTERAICLGIIVVPLIGTETKLTIFIGAPGINITFCCNRYGKLVTCGNVHKSNLCVAFSYGYLRRILCFESVAVFTVTELTSVILTPCPDGAV